MDFNRVLLTKKELSKYLRCSLPTIDSWMKAGILPYYRVGGKLIRFDMDEVDSSLGFKKKK
jgi:excisionase family DNA binding protein